MNVLDELYFRFREAVETAGRSERPSQFLQHWLARTLEDALLIAGKWHPDDVMLEVGVGSEYGRPRRIDVLVRNRVIIEVKKPRELRRGGRLEEARDQLLRYLKYLLEERRVSPEDVLAILTDGVSITYLEMEENEPIQKGPYKLNRTEFHRMIKTILRKIGEDPSPLTIDRTPLTTDPAMMARWLKTCEELTELLRTINRKLSGDDHHEHVPF